MSARDMAGRPVRLALLAAVMCLAAGAAGAETLRIRLLRTSHADGAVAAEIQDVMPALRNSLVFKSYSLMGTAQMALPANGEAVGLGGYTVTCSGTMSQLTIKVMRGKYAVLDTVASIRHGQPLILGGFTGGGGGQVVFVFTVQ
ncbi:MAG: hypothetical protein PHR35_05760 [Kiritimatiellae bacterium]|nr:hypothetical protein [Kiritimatiellia bacterium]